MTWVLGRAIPFGYAVSLSDIRVTFSDGSERDCLRKIYAVGPVIALGFAGSVAIGFAMVQRLAELLSSAKGGQGWDPTAVAQWWPADAQEVFKSFGQAERSLQCHLMMLAAHPTKNTSDNFDWPRCHVYRFFSPDFAPSEAAAWEIVSIGSGATIEHYVKRLQAIELSDDALQVEMLHPGAGMVGSIGSTIEDAPVSGISPHLHVCLVYRDRIEIGANDRRYIGRPVDEHFIMPPVAESLAELKAMLQTSGLSAERAVCQLEVRCSRPNSALHRTWSRELLLRKCVTISHSAPSR